MADAFSIFGNPSTIYYEGRVAKEMMEKSRQEVATLINASPDEIYFTSSGAESNNMAIKGIALGYQNKGNHIIISSIEHISVLSPAKSLTKMGFNLSFLPVDKYGVVDPDGLKRLIRKETILISVLFASNEIGTIEPIAEIAKIAQEYGIILHCDGCAAIGSLPVDVKELGVSSFSLSAHTFYGPKGIAALYLKKGVRFVPLIEGGSQEQGKRAGSENVLGIIGMGKAAEIAKRDMEKRIKRIRPLRDRIIGELPKVIERTYLTGHPINRLPGHCSFCFEFIEGEAILLFLDDEGISAASGSACTSRSLKASHVLLAIGLEDALAQGSIIFSLGKDNTEEDVSYLLAKLPPIVQRLREMSPLYAKYKKGKMEKKL